MELPKSWSIVCLSPLSRCPFFTYFRTCTSPLGKGGQGPNTRIHLTSFLSAIDRCNHTIRLTKGAILLYYTGSPPTLHRSLSSSYFALLSLSPTPALVFTARSYCCTLAALGERRIRPCLVCRFATIAPVSYINLGSNGFDVSLIPTYFHFLLSLFLSLSHSGSLRILFKISLTSSLAA